VVAKALFSSTADEWETPQDFFDRLDAEFGFVLDVCATAKNAKCHFFYTPNADGLSRDWHYDIGHRGAVWMNPPYGREIGKWVRKAYEESRRGATVVCLLPSRTDTKWWHTYVEGKAEVRFIKGRLKFGGSKNSAPFPSVAVIYRPPGGYEC
jgi:phage N-6-adenine-methyltransferase